jgi:DNA mismatch endonuclease (patch repair protein)
MTNNPQAKLRKRRPGVPTPSSPEAQRRMEATGSKDTRAELLVRSALHRMGFRFRVDTRPVAAIRRRADLVFPRARVAVFVDGCFWHGCPQHATWPKANAQFWEKKILTNQRRDADTNKRLAAEGWRVVRIWEHEDPTVAAERVAGIVRSRL